MRTFDVDGLDDLDAYTDAELLRIARGRELPDGVPGIEWHGDEIALSDRAAFIGYLREEV